MPLPDWISHYPRVAALLQQPDDVLDSAQDDHADEEAGERHLGICILIPESPLDVSLRYCSGETSWTHHGASYTPCRLLSYTMQRALCATSESILDPEAACPVTTHVRIVLDPETAYLVTWHGDRLVGQIVWVVVVEGPWESSMPYMIRSNRLTGEGVVLTCW